MSATEPRILLLETSGRIGHVAVAEGGNVRYAQRLDEARRHARDLVPAIAELLAAEHWRPKDVQAVFVSRGPGSYTGLRVGIMSAKTFAYVTRCTLLAIDTFAAIALQAPAEAPRIDIVADAQQEKVHVQSYTRLGTELWAPASPLRIERLADWLARRDANAWVLGPGLRTYGNRLPKEIPVAHEAAWDPQPQSLLKIGLERYRAGQQDDPWSVEPLYLRPSSAEEKWQQRPNP